MSIYKNTKEIIKELKSKTQSDFDRQIPTLVYKYCTWLYIYQSQIINSKNYMSGPTQKKQVAYFQCAVD